MPFAFENLNVYQRSLKLNGRIEELSCRLKGKVAYSYLDQLTRAALSIPLNIVEGNGRWHLKEKKNFFWISRGSTFEIVPLVQLFLEKGYITRQEYDVYYDDLDAISKMLTNLVHSVDKLHHE